MTPYMDYPQIIDSHTREMSSKKPKIQHPETRSELKSRMSELKGEIKELRRQSKDMSNADRKGEWIDFMKMSDIQDKIAKLNEQVEEIKTKIVKLPTKKKKESTY